MEKDVNFSGRMNSRKAHGVYTLIAVLLTAVSCVDDSYNLDKDISLDIQAGGDAFSIPVGNTDSIKLSDLIDESGMLITDEKGQYALTESDEIDPVDIQLDPVILEVEKVSLDPVNLNFVSVLEDLGVIPSGYGSRMITLPDTLAAGVEQDGTLHFNTKVPDELLSIRTLGLNRAFLAKYRFSLKLEGIPDGIGNVTLDRFQVFVPDFLRFSEADLVKDGVLHLNGKEFSPDEGFNLDLTVVGADFSRLNNGEGLKMEQIDGENRLILDADIGMKGTLKIGGGLIDLSELQEVSLIPEVTVASMQVQTFTGLINPEIEPSRHAFSLDLDEDLDFLKEDNVALGIHNPEITLVASNTIGIPVDLHVKMYAENHRGIIEGSRVQDILLKVNAAATDGQAAETKFLISRLGTTRDGYEAVAVPSLTNLLKVIPDSVVLELTAEASLDQTHHVDLLKKMELEGSYELMIPLQFDTLHVNYTDTIDGLLSDLEDISGKLRNFSLQLLMTAENTVPVNMTVDALPLDAKGRLIEGIDVSVQGSVTAGKSTDPVQSELIVSMKSNEGRLVDLDALVLQISGVSGSSEGTAGPLNANQFIRFTGMKLKAEGGVGLDLNE